MTRASNQAAQKETMAAQIPITSELAFLAKHTGQDELTLLSQALNLGLGMLCRQTVEEAFINETLSRSEAVSAIGSERVAEIEYAKQALAQDVARGLSR